MKHPLLAVIYYIIGIGCAMLAEKLSPSGPCTPGPALLVIMFLVLSSPVLFIIYLVVGMKRGKPYMNAAFIYLLACILSIFLFL